MAGRLLKWLLLFFIFNNYLFPEEGWNAYWGSPESYSKKIFTIGMQFNFINFQSGENNNKQVLVFLNDTSSNTMYFETLYEKLGRDVSLFEYKTDSRIFSNMPKFDSRRLQYYLTDKKLLAQWPPFFPEIKEMERELNAGDFKNKFLLLTGTQSNLLLQTRIYENYNRIILVSPDMSTQELEVSTVSGKQILWIGGQFESEKLNALKSKFGGEVLVYQRSSSGKNLLMSNLRALDDILAWLKS